MAEIAATPQPPLMQRRHYEWIADVIRETNLTPAERRKIARAMADALDESNPRFDRLRFLTACSVTH